MLIVTELFKGVVVGSWAGGVPNKSIGANNLRFMRAARINNRRKGNTSLMTIRNQRNPGGNNLITNRVISRNLYASKMNKSKNKKKTKKVITTNATGSGASDTNSKQNNKTMVKIEKPTDENGKENEASETTINNADKTQPESIVRECTVELQNG